MPRHPDENEVVVLGVCAAGKSTLARALKAAGYNARTVAQEHSVIPSLWKQSGAPITVYLHASFKAVKQRRESFMTIYNYEAQINRLREAREHATIKVDTSDITPEEVYRAVKQQIQERDRCQKPGEHPFPIPDELGSELPERPSTEDSSQDQPPVPDEPGEYSERRKYEGLPIPDEI